MSKTKNSPDRQSKLLPQVFYYLSIVGAIVFFVLGGLALWAHNFTSNMVNAELTAQKIYFPKQGSAGFEPSVYPELQQYTGMLVDSPKKAKAYANGYIGRHLKEVADGKMYAEVSAESMKNPKDQKLQQQKQVLFQGETLRGMLLTSGYGFGTIGYIAKIASILLFALSLISVVSAKFLSRRYQSIK